MLGFFLLLLSIASLYLLLLSFTSKVSLIRSLKEVHLKLSVMKEIRKNGCLAELLEAKQAR